MIITVPYEGSEDQVRDYVFDTDSVVLTEENVNDQSMRIAQEFSKWSLVFAQYRRKLLLLESKHAKWLAQAKQIVMDSTKLKYNSETAKLDGVLTFLDGNGVHIYAEEELRFSNKKAELLYYIDVLESAILKSLSMEKDMIVSLGAQMRAGYSATTNRINQ